MLQIHLSQSLAKEFESHLQDVTEPEPTALQWYAHKAIVQRRKCVVLMEYQSRYAMVFCGLTKREFDQFPELLQERIWREVNIICQLNESLSDDDFSILSDLTLDLTSKQYYQRGSDRSVMTHISQVIEDLRVSVEEGGFELPVNSNEAIHFGLGVNDMYRKRKNDKDYFVPLDIYTGFWLGLVDVVRSKQSKPGKSKSSARKGVTRGDDNVIHVDFGKQ
jgi:hypothetical protein